MTLDCCLNGLKQRTIVCEVEYLVINLEILYCTVFLTLSVKVTACFTKFHLIKGGYFLGLATRNRVLEKAALQQCNLIKARIIEVLETNVIPRRLRHQFFDAITSQALTQ